MLNTTKQYLEALSNGSIDTKTAEAARSAVNNVLKAAVEADTKNTGERSVDDELADMDTAIEEAAGRIEVRTCTDIYSILRDRPRIRTGLLNDK